VSLSKVKAFILAAVVSAGFAHIAEAAPSLTMTGASGNAGTTVSIPVNFNPDTSTISLMQFGFTLPTGFRLVSFSTGAATTAAGKSLSFSVNGQSVIFLVAALNTNAIGTGSITTLQISIPAGATAGARSLSFSDVEFSAQNGSIVAGTSTGASITVTTSGGGTDTTPPTAPTNVRFTNTSNTGFTVNWNASTDNVAVNSYRLDIARDAAFTTYQGGYQNLNVGNVLTRVVTGMISGVQYYVRVRAVDNAGNASAYSQVATVTTTSLPPAEAPTFSPNGGTFASAVQVTIQSATSGAQIRYTVDGSVPTNAAPLYAGPITISQTMTLRARAYRSDLAESPYSSAFFTIGGGTGGTLQMPTLNLPDTLSTRAEITLDYPVSGCTFEWTIEQIATESGASNGVTGLRFPAPARIGTTSASLALSSQNLSPGRYRITVQAFKAGQQSPIASDEVTLGSEVLNSVRIYPNPWRKSSGRSGIAFEGLGPNSSIQIFTVSGHLVREYKGVSGSKTWDITTRSGDAAASGVYIYVIKDGEGNKRRGKIAVVR
jgi:hypothetical protein